MSRSTPCIKNKLSRQDRDRHASFSKSPAGSPEWAVRAQLWRNHERTPIICSSILLPSPSSLEWAPPGRSPARGTVGSGWPRAASSGPREGTGVLADFQVSLPTDLILFFLFFFFLEEWGWRRGADSGAFSCGASWAARGLKATTRVAWSGTGPSPRAGVSYHPVLLPLRVGGGFRRERVAQRRWSHSRPVRSWLRPGLAGPFEPTRAGDSAGGSPRTPELGLYGRTKASQTRLLDAKFENKANLEKPGVGELPVLAKPPEEPRLWGGHAQPPGGVFLGFGFFRRALLGDSPAARGSLPLSVSSGPTLPWVHCGVPS